MTRAMNSKCGLRHPKLIALTGCIGAGKSKVADIFRELGAYIIDADELARRAVEPDSAAYRQIVENFGDTILAADGKLNRSKLAEIVFSNADQRLLLERIVHPAVRSLFEAELEHIAHRSDNMPEMVCYVIPLLFESRIQHPKLDAIVVVSADPELCIQRIVKRDRCSVELAEAKLKAQLPIKEKEKLADYVIYNNETLESLEKAVQEVFLKLQNL